MRGLGVRLTSRKFWVAVVTAALIAAGVPEEGTETLAVAAVGGLYLLVEGLLDARYADGG